MSLSSVQAASDQGLEDGGPAAEAALMGEGQVFSVVGLYRGRVVTIRRLDSPKLSITGRAVQLHLKAVCWACS